MSACRHPAWLLSLETRHPEGLEPKILEALLTNGRLTLAQVRLHVCFQRLKLQHRASTSQALYQGLHLCAHT